MASRSEPLSIESLLQQQRKEKEAASKVRIIVQLSMRAELICVYVQPKFLSKEERAKIAIAKRAQEIREEKEKRCS